MATTRAVTRPSHVFLSHAGADTQAARQFAEILRRSGIEVWFDKDNLQPGDQWMATLEDAIQTASAMVVYVGRMGIQTWVDREVRLGLVRSTQSRQNFRFIPVLGEGSEPDKLPAFVRQQQCTDLRDQTRAAEQIRKLVEVLRNQSDQAVVLSDYWNTHTPFRSLQVFGADDSWLFFGRDRDTDELLTRMSVAPALAVIGNSGSGKSSLIQAGLIPALRRGRFRYNGKWTDSWRTVVFRPSISPFDSLAEMLPGQLAPELSPADRAEFVNYCKKSLPAQVDGLRNAIVALPRPSGATPDATRVLLVADQFEELFTLCEDKAIRKAYIDSLLTAAQLDGAVPVHLVVVLRADFYSNCLDYPNLSEHFSKNTYNVPLVSAPQLREAIENRLALAGAHAETGLIDSLLTDVAGEPGNLALLEHALSRLWDKCGGSGSTLTSDAYAEIGRLKGALGKYADEIYYAIQDQEDQRLTRKLFLELVQLGEGAQDTRRRVPKKILLEIGPRDKIERLIADLASKCLLTTGSQGSRSLTESFVEVSHEALIREWATLRGWLTDSREDLRVAQLLLKAAEEWDALKKDAGALLRGARLAQGTEWLAKNPESHSLVRELIEASNYAQEEDRRKELESQEREITRQKELLGRSRRFNYAIGALLLCSAAFSAFIYHEEQELDADRLASLSRSFSDDDRLQAFLVSLYALQTSENRGTIEAVQDAIQRIVKPIVLGTGPLTGVSASSDGKLLAAAWEGGSVAILEPGSPQQASDPAHIFREKGSRLSASGSVAALAVSANGRWLAAAGNRPDIDLWALADPGKAIRLPFPTGTVKSLEFNPSESALLIASWDAGVSIQNLNPASSSLKTFPNYTKTYQAKFNVIDQSIGIALARGAVAILPSGSGTDKLIENQGAAVKSLDFSPDGTHLAFGDTSKLTIVSLSGTGQRKTMPTESGIDRTLFSPKGNLVVTMNSVGSAAVWDLARGEVRMQLSATEPFRSAAFSRVGNAPHVAFGTAAGKLLLYDLDITHLRKRAHEIWLENNSPTLTDADCRNYLRRKTCPALQWR